MAQSEPVAEDRATVMRLTKQDGKQHWEYWARTGELDIPDDCH